MNITLLLLHSLYTPNRFDMRSLWFYTQKTYHRDDGSRMKTEIVRELTESFESHAQQTEGGVDFWLARDIQHLLGYSEWRNFNGVISKAKIACEVSWQPPGDHFVDVNKTIAMPKGALRRKIKKHSRIRKCRNSNIANEKQSVF